MRLRRDIFRRRIWVRLVRRVQDRDRAGVLEAWVGVWVDGTGGEAH